MATRHVLADLAAAYAEQTGRRIAFESIGGVDAAARIRAGEPQDVLVLASEALARLEAEGHVASGSRVDVASSSVAVAVPAGAPRPPISDEDAVRRAALAAQVVCYSTGPSGDHLKRLWSRWGFEAKSPPHLLQAPAGTPVAAVLARGDATLGFQQFSEFIDATGIDILGPLPPNIQAATMFSAAVASTSKRPDEARAFIAYIASPEADAEKRRRGLEPARRP